MSIGSAFLGIALLVLFVLFLARPFLKKPVAQRGMTRRQNLLVQKEVILDQIRSLDFDHDTGKIPDRVYQSQRAYLLSAASGVLRELDEADGSSGKEVVVPVPSASDVDTEIEEAIARFRHSRALAHAAPTNGKQAFCTHCGRPTDPGDRFCAHCGYEVRTTKPA